MNKIYVLKISAILLTGLVISGCVRLYNIGSINTASTNYWKEFVFDNYKMKILVSPTGEDNAYTYSVILLNKESGANIRNVKSYLNVKKYPPYTRFYYRRAKNSNAISGNIEPIYDSTSKYYNYKYKFKHDGKYEISLKLTAIEGLDLNKDIMVSFDQEVR